MTGLQEHEIYPLIGDQGFARLCELFYREVRDDDVLRPMYPEGDLSVAEKRLRDFLIYRFGGPDDYIRQRGHPRLRLRHAPFEINQLARDRWLLLMRRAMQQAELDADAAEVLLRFFDAMSTFLINRPE